MPDPVVDILMYHSISQADGATSISPDIFAAQMTAIHEAGVPVITMDDYLAAREGALTLADYSIIITFDDGFRDFCQCAWPVLSELGFRPIVYLPTDAIGREEAWVGAHQPQRQLMSWHEICCLHGKGVLFGSHTVSHANLNIVSDETVGLELNVSCQHLTDHLGERPLHFAPPYGLASKGVRDAIAKEYKTSVGTRLGSAGLTDDIMDLPRLEMYYFSDLKRWRAHLDGRGAGYLRTRKMLRSVRQSVLSPWN